MAENKEVKVRKKEYPFRILDILRDFSDEDHPLTQARIMEYLKSEYALDVERKAIKANLDALQDMDYPVVYNYAPYKRGDDDVILSVYYDKEDGQPTEGELSMMIDSILCSRFINAGQADHIVDWLKNQGTLAFKNSVQHTTYKSAAYGHHVYEGDVFMNTEAVLKAINTDRKIVFDYNDFNEKGRLALKEKDVIASPYHKVVYNGRYYLICNLDDEDGFRNYRMEKMSNVRVLEDKPRREMRKLDPGFEMDRYINSSIYMFSSKDKNRHIRLRIKRSCFSDLFDYFGDKFTVSKADSDEEYAVVTLSANLDGMYFWALQYGNNVEVLEPQELRDKIRESVTVMNLAYSITDEDKYSIAIAEAKKESDLKFLKLCRELDLEGINLKKKSEHLGFDDLYALSIGFNGITDYSFINDYKSLVRLRMTDISILENLELDLPELKTLTLGDRDAVWEDREQHLDNLEPIRKCKDLRRLRLEGVEVDNYDVLYELPNLESVSGLLNVNNIDISRFDCEVKVAQNRFGTRGRLLLMRRNREDE